MTTLLILCIPLTAVVVGFLTLQAVRLGLKWQIQTMKQETPTLDIPNSVKEVMQNNHAPKMNARQEKEIQNILDEWVNGVEER